MKMFYLTTHSTHFVYDYMALDLVKDHSATKKKKRGALAGTSNSNLKTHVHVYSSHTFTSAMLVNYIWIMLSSQYSTTDVTKTSVGTILYVGWFI